MINEWNNLETYQNLPNEFYSMVSLSPVEKPKTLLLNKNLSRYLGIDPNDFSTKEGLDLIAGNCGLKGQKALSQAYAGHQFGYFTMLGDGRAVLIGEIKTPKGELFDMQLKGSGKTPYSRGGDGRAALGPMLREYIISEAMDALGISTTRCLALVETGEKVQREKLLPGAILTRVAKSHLRIGTIQYAAAMTTHENLIKIIDYSVNRHYPECKQQENPYLCFFKKIIENQAGLIAKWQRVGFIHGVMNTDNMTISGETIDYGPCAFMDEYKENTVFSSIDNFGRYSYGNQPKIGKWNLARLGECLIRLIHQDEKVSIKLIEEALNEYDEIYQKFWLKEMSGRLGILHPKKEHVHLIEDLLSVMENHSLDYTNTFLALMEELMVRNEIIPDAIHKIDKIAQISQWKEGWYQILKQSDRSFQDIIETMKAYNPRVIPRNHIVERVLKDCEKDGNFDSFHEFLKILKKPYDHDFFFHDRLGIHYQEPAPKSGKPYKTFCGT